ncbi:hypothetical protein I316_07150 [Kwoniella heveanensis BCC8398]|uniref:Uncharacterized protein n=1 Tax=Kwoniella heveanensis BCC8398 TaxID=1296120 RepID=A0A1B9GJB2_9TREE|nr:hypothetical protein I316_07150 [Kwoniella heveanensis BCC8398]
MRFTSTVLALLPFLFSLGRTVSAIPQDLTDQLAAANAAQWPVNGQQGCPLDAAKDIYYSHSARLGGSSTSVVMGFPTAGAQPPADACQSVAGPEVTKAPAEARALPQWKKRGRSSW